MSNTQHFFVFARWKDEERWEIAWKGTNASEAILAPADDMAKHIERTEQPGCPKRQYIIALAISTADADPIPDGKREVSMRIEVRE